MSQSTVLFTHFYCSVRGICISACRYVEQEKDSSLGRSLPVPVWGHSNRELTALRRDAYKFPNIALACLRIIWTFSYSPVSRYENVNAYTVFVGSVYSLYLCRRVLPLIDCELEQVLGGSTENDETSHGAGALFKVSCLLSCDFYPVKWLHR